MRQGEGRRRQEPASYALASGGKGGREGEDRRCRFKREQAQKDGTDGKVARRMLQSMNLAKRESFDGGMRIAYLHVLCHCFSGGEWHETILNHRMRYIKIVLASFSGNVIFSIAGRNNAES